MKRNSIKKISIFLITFVCMFLLTEKVKAGKYVCNYPIAGIENVGELKPEDYYKNFELRLIYDNGNYSIGTYKNGTFYSSTNSKFSRNDGFFVGSLNEIDEVVGPLSISDATLNNFKTYNISTEKKCPNRLYYSLLDDSEGSGGKHGTYYINQEDTGFDIDGGECSGTPDCGVVLLNNNTSEQNTSQGSDGGGQTIDNQEFIECDYGDTVMFDVKGEIKREFTLKFNSSTAYIDNYSEDMTYQLYINFEPRQLNGKCPNVLYSALNANGNATNGIAALHLSNSELDNFESFGLIVSLSTETGEPESIQDNVCNGKTKELIKGFYNFVRFIVPFIIVVFSIIDFAGVVLSGETEKMEKAKKKFMIRLLVGAAFLFIPALLELLLRVIGIIESGQGLAEFTCNIFK